MTTLRNSVKPLAAWVSNQKSRKLEKTKNGASFHWPPTTFGYNAKGEKVEQTDWHNIKAFGKYGRHH